MKCFFAAAAALAAFAITSTPAVAAIAAETNLADSVPNTGLMEIDVPFVDADVYYTNATDSQLMEVSEDDDDGEDRQLQVVEGVVAAFTIASAVVPLITDAIKNNKKECQQLACWISTPSRTCAIGAAAQVQAKITKGRDNWGYESIQSNGMWVRYWRTKFEPADRGDIASGKCTDGNRFVVTNCQSTGRVHC